jgi:tRNA U34 5-methylaminomethyl-2-thiouridine-forming methyltransferase MnmC
MFKLVGMSSNSDYRIVKLAGGAHSVHSLAHHETFHPVVGPVVEAEALYVRQLGIAERFRKQEGEFVVWDVGLGAAANSITLLQALKGIPGKIRIVSFDHTLEPLQFALQHTSLLPYLLGYESLCEDLVTHHRAELRDSCPEISWEMHLSDFPTLLMQSLAQTLAKPHAVMFDAFSPAKNPAMWTGPVFANLFRLLDPARPCALPTYSRSTILRVTLLLAGFFVGVGHATGEKEETTVAANTMSLIAEPLDRRWLERARRSSSAEPLWEPVYRQAPLAPATWQRLQEHSQFS